MEERYVDKLAKYILLAAGVAIVGGLCWYFRSVLINILIAVVVSLIAKPIMKQLQRLNIKGRRLPDWFLAAFTLITLLIVFSAVITMVVPIVSNIVSSSRTRACIIWRPTTPLKVSSVCRTTRPTRP